MQNFHGGFIRGIIVILALFLNGGQSAKAQLTQSAEFAPNRVIVKLKPQNALGKARQVQSTLQAEIRATTVQRLDLINAEIWDVSGSSVEDVVSRWKDDPRIEYIEPDYIVHASITPNDPLFAQLWGMTMIQAPQAWDMTTGGNVLIGVIDTGVDYNHPDLAANMWVNTAEQNGTPGVDDDNNGFVDDIHGYDFVNNDGDPMDDNFHGTHVSGAIAAVGNNGVGVVGVNWSAQIMAIKFLNAFGSGSTSNAILAVQYATQMGAQLTNNSWGGGGFSQALSDAIDAAGAANSMFVAAAGNGGFGEASYPALHDLDNIISVAATDENDLIASFSQYNAVSVDLGAPGVNILSTFPTAHPNGPYSSISGTSMATPHVVGVAALIWSLRPTLSFDDVKAIILNSVDANASLNGKTVTGGRLNAYNAVMLAQTWTPLIPPLITASPQSFSVTLDPDASTSETLSISNQAGARDLRWNITDPGCGWLSFDKLSGKTAGGATDQVQLTIDAFALDPGNYQCTFDINSNDLANPVVQVVVDLTVNFLPPPVASVAPPSFFFALNTGESASDILTISNNANAGERNLHWSAVLQGSNIGWLSINLTSGVIAPQNSQAVQVNVNAISLPTGTYQATIALTSSDPNNPSFQIPVELMVTEPVIGGQQIYTFNNSGKFILRSDLDGGNVATVQAGLASPLDGAVDEINRKLYWIDLSQNIIYRSDLNGTNKEAVLSGLSRPFSITVDAANSHVYWIEVFPVADRRIRRANFDGTGVVTLVNLTGQNNNGLSLDLAGGKMYWCQGFNIPSPEGIWRANLDGSNPERVVVAQADPFGLGLDLVNGKMYWGEVFPDDVIRRANLDGSNVENVFTGFEISDLAIDVANGKLYWARRDGSGIQRGNTDGTNIESLNLSGGGIALDLGGPPVAADAGNDQEICVGQSVQIGGSPTGSGGNGGPFTFSWTPTTGLNSAAIANPTASPAATTTYTVTVTETSTGLSSTDAVTITVQLNLEVTVNSPAVCAGNLPAAITASASSGTAPFSYVWTVPGGAVNPGNAASFDASVAGNYAVVVTDANGCTGSGSGALTVQPDPSADAGADATIFTGGETTLGGSPTASGGTGALTIAWTPTSRLDDPSAANPTAELEATTTYTVTVTDENGCESTDEVTVTVKSNKDVITEQHAAVQALIDDPATPEDALDPLAEALALLEEACDFAEAGEIKDMLNAMRDAAEALEEAREEMDGTDEIASVLADLARHIATEKKEEAETCTAPDPKGKIAGDIEDGDKDLAAGDLEYADGYFGDAIKDFRKAWEGYCDAVDRCAAPKAASSDQSSVSSEQIVVSEFALHQNYPNPFNPATTIQFDLIDAGNVSLNIYNSAGQLVRTLVSGDYAPGAHKVVWDARDNSGGRVASGLYLYTIRVGRKFTAQRKFLLMK